MDEALFVISKDAFYWVRFAHQIDILFCFPEDLGYAFWLVFNTLIHWFVAGDRVSNAKYSTKS